jgi:hypothetical protein
MEILVTTASPTKLLAARYVIAARPSRYGYSKKPNGCSARRDGSRISPPTLRTTLRKPYSSKPNSYAKRVAVVDRNANGFT